MKINRDTAYAYKLLIPLFIFFTIFIFYPLGFSLYLTFHDFSLIDLIPVFIGLGNYSNMPKDPVFIQALYQTMYFTVVSTAIGIPLALGIALLLNENFRGRTLARVSLLLPWATPPVVVAGMFKWMLDRAWGIVNYLLEITWLAPEGYNFLSDPKIAINSLILVFLWKMVPVYSIITLSSLQNVPTDVLDSAKVYGANVFKRFTKVYLPYLRSSLAVLCVLSVLMSLVFNFDLVMALTSGGPGYYTYTLYFLGYITTFWFLNAGYGVSIAYIVMVICLVSSLIILKVGRR